jgi:hypothetical protein
MVHRVFSWSSVFLLVAAVTFAATLPVVYSVPFFGFSLASAMRAISIRRHSDSMRSSSYLVLGASLACLIWTMTL